MGRILICIDNEGPLTKNDNAFEITIALAKAFGLGEDIGKRFYKAISNIDDIWGDFRKLINIDPTYSSGHTLKIMLAFYKAMGATESWLYKFSGDNIKTVLNVKEALNYLDKRYNVRQVSTSYDFFIKAFCDEVGFDFNKAFCTKVKNFDNIPISEKESEELRDFMREVAEMPEIKYDKNTGKINPEHQQYYDRITDFIWNNVYNMQVGRFFKEVHPIGQDQKWQCVYSTYQENNISLEDVFYIGDSQTDVRCVKEIREKGLTMMFNGKGKVCDLSNLMYIGEDARIISTVADDFASLGREGVLDKYTLFSENCATDDEGLIAKVTPKNLGFLKKLSKIKRENFRGVDIGGLS